MQIADFLKQGIAWRKAQTLENQGTIKSWQKKFFRPLTLPVDLYRVLLTTWRNGGKKRVKSMLGLILVIGFLGYIAFTLVALVLSIFFMAFDSLIYGHVLVSSSKNESLWRTVINLIATHPIIGVRGDMGILINVLIYYWIIVLIASFVLVAYEWIRGTGNIVRKYVGTDFVFTDAEYDQAAQALEDWKSFKYDSAVQKYGERIVDILVLSETIYPNKFNKWTRAVSINAIKEDREPRDDEE